MAHLQTRRGGSFQSSGLDSEAYRTAAARSAERAFFKLGQIWAGRKAAITNIVNDGQTVENPSFSGPGSASSGRNPINPSSR